MVTTGLRTCRSLEEEARSQLDLPRVADAWYVPIRLPERRTSAVALVLGSEIRRVEQVEELDEGAYLPVAASAQVEELRRSHVEDEGVVTSCRVERHLLARCGIDEAIAAIVAAVAVPIQVRARQEVVWTRARELNDRRQLDAVTDLEDAGRDHAVPLVGTRWSPFT